MFSFTLLLTLYLACLSDSVLAQERTLGLTESGRDIPAYEVAADRSEAPRVVVIGGLSGDAAGSDPIMAAYRAYQEGPRPVDVVFIPDANPDRTQLAFPPRGAAYEDGWTSWSLWRWIGLHAPDLVLTIGPDPQGLGPALEAGILDLGHIPHTRLEATDGLTGFLRAQSDLEPAPARTSLNRRLERSPMEVAAGLADTYGQEVPAYLTYLPGMALIGRMRLGQESQVQALMETYLDENPDVSIENSLQIAGHLVFAELAERTGETRYLEVAERVASLGFDDEGDLLQAMPFHGDYSDAFFMATPLLARVGRLTGNTRYFDLALRHVEYLHDMLIREDGLYDHWPRASAAWGRGNAFVALGLALSLSDFPEFHPGHSRLLEIFRDHMRTLLDHVDPDGMWHNVINVPGSWAELSATAMIGTALQRGIDRGWLDSAHQEVVDRAWRSVLQRTDDEFGFVNVCASTPGQNSLEAYLNRPAIVGRDERAGGMMLMFATERLQNQSATR